MIALRLVVAIAGGIGANIAAVTGAVAAYLANFRVSAQRQAVIEFAASRIAFSDQVLKLELAASTTLEHQALAKARASEAAQRVRSEADLEMKRLNWGQEVRTSPHPFSLSEWPFGLSGWERFWWLMVTSVSLCFVCLAVIFAGFLIWYLALHPDTRKLTSYLEGSFTVFVALLTAAYYQSEADRLRFKKPKPTLIDKL